MNSQTHSNDLVVAVFMVTFNHEHFIDQAISSVIGQKTSFNFKLFIGEDCSHDKTREKCEEWAKKFPEKIDLLESHQNLGIFKNANRVFEACLFSGAEYIALLEGDDCWTDDLKLEKQISLLKENPQAAGSYHNTVLKKKDGSKKVMFKNLPLKINQEQAISKYTPFHTSSFIFKSKYFFRPDWFSKIESIDLALFAAYAQFGGFVGTNEVMSRYNHHDGGNTSSADWKRFFHEKRILLHRYTKGKIQEDITEKANGLIKFHTENLTKNTPLPKMSIVGFLKPSVGDIDNSRFIQMSLDAEIIPFTLMENKVKIYKEEISKPWWVLNGERWLLKTLKKKFLNEPEAFYIQDPQQLQFLYSISKKWKTPIINDFLLSKSTIPLPPFQKINCYFTHNHQDNQFPAPLKVRPAFFSRIQGKKNKNVFIGPSKFIEPHKIELSNIPEFEFYNTPDISLHLEDVKFLASIFHCVISEETLVSITQIVQLFFQGAIILLKKNIYPDLPENIEKNIIRFQAESEIIEILKNKEKDYTSHTNIDTLIDQFNLAYHCQMINRLIEKP